MILLACCDLATKKKSTRPLTCQPPLCEQGIRTILKSRSKCTSCIPQKCFNSTKHLCASEGLWCLWDNIVGVRSNVESPMIIYYVSLDFSVCSRVNPRSGWVSFQSLKTLKGLFEFCWLILTFFQSCLLNIALVWSVGKPFSHRLT